MPSHLCLWAVHEDDPGEVIGQLIPEQTNPVSARKTKEYHIS